MAKIDLAQKQRRRYDNAMYEGCQYEQEGVRSRKALLFERTQSQYFTGTVWWEVQGEFAAENASRFAAEIGIDDTRHGIKKLLYAYGIFLFLYLVLFTMIFV